MPYLAPLTAVDLKDPVVNNTVQLIDLIALGRRQAVDTDCVLSRIGDGKLLLLNLRPQTYPSEQHATIERIVVLQGRVGLCVDTQTVHAESGQMIVIPAGLVHGFSAESDGVVAVIFGGA